MFRSARIKLTVVYTVAIALVMAAFSIALYFSISSAMATNLEVPEKVSPGVEHAILLAQLGRARLALVAINVVGWVAAAGASYYVSGRTLGPIQEALDRQKQFTAHASHVLRTPLTVMKGELNVALTRDRSPQEYREALDRVEEEVDQLEMTVSGLLALARLEAGGRQEPEYRSVLEEVEKVVSPFRRLSDEQGIRLETVVPDNIEACFEWPRIEQLLTNLLDNAMRHVAEGGRILVHVTRPAAVLQLSIYNTGAHIDQNDLPHLFLPFYRGKRTEADTGTGLGLAFCEWIARSADGSIRARNVGDGVSFDVYLPLH